MSDIDEDEKYDKLIEDLRSEDCDLNSIDINE